MDLWIMGGINVEKKLSDFLMHSVEHRLKSLVLHFQERLIINLRKRALYNILQKSKQNIDYSISMFCLERKLFWKAW